MPVAGGGGKGADLGGLTTCWLVEGVQSGGKERSLGSWDLDLVRERPESLTESLDMSRVVVESSQRASRCQLLQSMDGTSRRKEVS